jgi:hypothetical protein
MSREYVEGCKHSYSFEQESLNQPFPIDDSYIHDDLNDTFIQHGKLVGFKGRVPNKTAFVPSLFHPILESYAEPALLGGKGDSRAPGFSTAKLLINACNRKGEPTLLDQDILNEVVTTMVERKKAMLKGKTLETLTVDEAINGVPGTSMKSMAIGTSAGFYYGQQGHKGKHGVLSENPPPSSKARG